MNLDKNFTIILKKSVQFQDGFDTKFFDSVEVIDGDTGDKIDFGLSQASNIIAAILNRVQYGQELTYKLMGINQEVSGE